MNPGSRESWPPPPQGHGQSGGAPGGEQGQSQQQRPMGGYGPAPPGQPQQTSPRAGPSGPPVLPPPSGSFYPSNQPSGHNLPGLTSLTQPSQTSPGQPSQRPTSSSQDGPQAAHPHGPGLQGGNYPLPAMNPGVQSHPHGQPQPNYDRERERELREREMREQEMAERHREDMARREEAQREHEMRERQQQQAQQQAQQQQQAQHHEQVPHENHAGAIHLHQPVAVPPNRGIHAPGGLLGNSAPSGTQAAVGGPSGPGGPVSIFGGGQVPQGEGHQRAPQPHPGPGQTLLVPSGGGAAALQTSVAMGQGQQPILNDALSYLDQVKVQFADQPDVYNRFLDIMKDFKGGVIDTPGVIERVSTLFTGNPSLIQGFNTFLPPGYKIECGTGDDPNAIRVTTPQGTTVQQMPASRPLSNPRSGPMNGLGAAGADRSYYGMGPRVDGAAWQQQQVGAGPQDTGYGSSQPAGHLLFGQNAPGTLSPEMQARDHPAAGLAAMGHQADHRVAQLQGAAAAAGGNGVPRHGVISPSGGRSTTPMATQALNGAAAQQGGTAAGLEKRGPVEFNHAINYVNKIKNRFSSQPDIYKQFLEILQTYQRESKPIQDVYSQVTHLFNAAPDLLEDFKQFLPESAAQARAAAARQAADDAVMVSAVRNEPYAATPQRHTPRPQADPSRLPPVGNFATTPTLGRDNKRKRGDRQGTVNGPVGMGQSQAEVAGRGGFTAGGVNKRPKQHQSAKQATVPEPPAVSPTLTPALPQPIPPGTTAGASNEELAFFDRVRKFVGNKNMMNEFLKLCNLFSQDLMERGVLLHRAQMFIGGNPELMEFFRNFLGYDDKDEVIENRARPVNSRVALANCRGLGPSYRLLPKQERQKACSGRDELCHAVLNDEWASHPTWASEDSGFVAHRKNQQEETLHRIEEERHDYDYNVEACARTVQLLEPIAQQFRVMNADEVTNFTLPTGLGGQSETIPRRVIMKMYGREKGREVIQALFQQPYTVIPVLLNRLKMKLEEWKAAQREWEKVWREQTHKTYYKSLDHQHVNLKLGDTKRQFQPKTLQNEISVKYEEQKRMREIRGLPTPPYQHIHDFSNIDVLLDATHLILAYTSHSFANDYDRLAAFYKEFVPLFVGMDGNKFSQKIDALLRGSTYIGDTDEEAPTEDGFASRAQRANGKKGGLLRDVLDRSRSGPSARNENDGSNASGSRDSTPEIGSAMDEEMAGGTDTPNVEGVNGNAGMEKWIDIPGTNDLVSPENAPDQPYRRATFTMYGNLSIYCFFHIFALLHGRLELLKNREAEVHAEVELAKRKKPARELKMLDKEPEDYWADVGPDANYYAQMLGMFHEFIRGEIDMASVEETLRRWYLHIGYNLYLLDRMLGTLVRSTLSILNNEGKDKSHDIYNLFRKDRQREETTFQDELHYRKQVEKYAKEGELYRISFNQDRMKATVRLFKKDELSLNPSRMPAGSAWKYYVASWQGVDVTEGVDAAAVQVPFAKTAVKPLMEMADDAANAVLDEVRSAEHLKASVSPDYRLHFSPRTDEHLVKSERLRRAGVALRDDEDSDETAANEEGEDTRLAAMDGATDEVADADAERVQRRIAAAVDKLVANNEWTKDLDRDAVDSEMKAFQEQLRAGSAASGGAQQDAVMGGM